jgi:hypothetical protein
MAVMKVLAPQTPIALSSLDLGALLTYANGFAFVAFDEKYELIRTLIRSNGEKTLSVRAIEPNANGLVFTGRCLRGTKGTFPRK